MLYILISDYGYGEISVSGITEDEKLARKWKNSDIDREYYSCELTNNLPLEGRFLECEYED